MSFRIAAFPKCFEYEIGLYHTMSVFDWISKACIELDVDGLEMYDRFFTSLDKNYLLRVKDAVEGAGFIIPMLICSPDFTQPDIDDRQRAIEYQVKMIEVAALLGGKGTVCRILSGQQRPEVSRQQGVEWVVSAIEEVIPVAKEKGVILGMENHYKDSQWKYPEFALKMEVFLEIINSIHERQYFGVQYDPSNAIVAGDDPITLLKMVKDRVVSMHASDRYLKEGVTREKLREMDGTMGYAPYLCHGVIGKGLNDYDKIFTILADIRFRGWVSIEDGTNGIDEMRESATFLQRMRMKYFPDR
jgi:sugar phosphate isomerase/epimerase